MQLSSHLAPLPLVRESLRLSLQKLYGERLAAAFLFGSFARGDAGPDSDIDVAVVLRGPYSHRLETERCSEIRSRISAETGRLLDLAFLSLAQWQGSLGEPEIYRSIRQDAIPL